MTYGQLPAARVGKTWPDGSHTEARQPVLLCRVCGETFSAHPGDYFMVAPNTPIKHCGRLMRLVERRTVYADVTV